jgi:hypothetical protein
MESRGMVYYLEIFRGLFCVADRNITIVVVSVNGVTRKGIGGQPEDPLVSDPETQQHNHMPRLVYHCSGQKFRLSKSGSRSSFV